MKKLFGVTAAMITPMNKDESINLSGLEQLTEFLINRGVNGLYPCGTTGEMLHLSVEEREQIAETVVWKADGRVPVYIHCGAMLYQDTIRLLKHAVSIGADGAGVVTPAFFSANDRELESYYTSVADSVPELPIYLYNIPQCAANDLNVDVAQRIASRCPNIVGIKYSYADINRTINYTGINGGRFSVLHGCDRAFISMLALGCEGTVSGCASVFPEPFVAAYKAYCEGDLVQAQAIQKVCVKFVDLLHSGSNMSYFKEALKMRGLNAGHMKQPQLDISTEERVQFKREVETLCKEEGVELNVQV